MGSISLPDLPTDVLRLIAEWLDTKSKLRVVRVCSRLYIVLRLTYEQQEAARKKLAIHHHGHGVTPDWPGGYTPNGYRCFDCNALWLPNGEPYVELTSGPIPEYINKERGWVVRYEIRITHHPYGIKERMYGPHILCAVCNSFPAKPLILECREFVTSLGGTEKLHYVSIKSNDGSTTVIDYRPDNATDYISAITKRNN